MTQAILPDALFATNRRIWRWVGALVLINVIWLLAAGIAVDFSKAGLFFIVFIICMALSTFYHYVRRDDYLFFLGQITAQLLLAILSMGILSYLGQRFNLPLYDDLLVSIDKALGFDWHAYLAWVDARPVIAKAYTFTYFSSGPQIMLFVAMLFITKHVAHIQRYIMALIICAIITIILASTFPAVGGYIYYDVDIAASYQNLRPAAGRIHEAPLFALRSGEMTTLKFPLEGIVTFPSFHSTLSMLLIYASWPIRWLRFIAIPLNIFVLFSTPVDGGHWLVDVIGGVAVAALGIWLTGRLLPSSQTTKET